MDDSTPTAELRHVRKGSVQKVRGLRRTAVKADDIQNEESSQHHHGHGEKDPSILTACASASINFLLMFGLCCAYGIIMFEDDYNSRHRGLGVKMNLCSALIMGLLLSAFSKVGCAIGGPDLNPVVFLGMFVQGISTSVAKQLGLAFPDEDGRRLLDGCADIWDPHDPMLRQLGGGGSKSNVEWCTGYHYEKYSVECDKYHEQLRATTIFAVAFSSGILGCLFFCLGKWKMTRFVAYVPTNIMEAFLSCVGYKVFKYALKFCKYKPQQFVPAACVGVPLYFMKAMHIGNPAVVIPSVLLIPLAIFYVILYGAGGTVYSAREAGWMFDTLENVDFWTVWTASLGNISSINFSAWMSTATDLMVMIIVCLLDCMLKVSSTESKLPVTVSKDYEVQLFGYGNFITPLCGSSVGYMQLKFNIINFGVMGNVKDRRAGAMYAILCGCIFFWTTDMFNYLPRFFLSTLLFFAGSGFVVENLWGSRKYLSVSEWLQNIVILGVFVMLQSLLYAVIVGGLIAGATFIIRCANVPCISGKARAGGEGKTLMKRGVVFQKKLQHVANCWLLVINLKGYIFFAAAQKLIGEITQRLEWEAAHIPEFQRLHWIIFDCTQLEGLDSSASKAFGKLATVAKHFHLEVIWSRVDAQLMGGLQACGTITDDHQLYASLADARNSVENAIQEYIYDQEEKWQSLHPLFNLAHQMVRDRMALEPFEDMLKLDMARSGCPWDYCTRVEMHAFHTLLWRTGELRKTIFLVHSGKVGMFTNIPADMSNGEWPLPVAVFGRGMLLNHEAFRKVPTWFHAVAIEDGELLCWTEVGWTAMSRECPAMASSVLHAMLKQEEDCEVSRGAVAPGGPPGNKKGNQAEVELCRSSETSGCLDQLVTEHMVPRKPPPLLGEEDLLPYLRPLSTAKGLMELGMFDHPGNEPSLRLTNAVMDSIQKDLTTAFHTFRTGEQDNAYLAADKIGEALMYAGVFGLALLHEQPSNLTEAEFIDLGRQLTLAGFSKKQTETLLALFKRKAKSGTMSRTDLATLMRDAIFKGLSMEEVDDLVTFCAGSNARSVDEEEFLACMQRLVRRHEREYFIMQGIRCFLGNAECDDLSDRLTPDMLVQRAVVKLTEEEAAELLWSASFDSCSPEYGPSLNIRMVPLALWPCRVPALKLPPPPRQGPAPPPPAPAIPLPPVLGGPDKVVAVKPRLMTEKQTLVASLFGAGGANGPPPKPLPPVFTHTEGGAGCAILEVLEADGGSDDVWTVPKPSTPPPPSQIVSKAWSQVKTMPSHPLVVPDGAGPDPVWRKMPEEDCGQSNRSTCSQPSCSAKIRSLLADVRTIPSSSVGSWPQIRCQRVAAYIEARSAETLQLQLSEDEKDDEKGDEKRHPKTCRARTYLFLEDPQSSKAAGCWSVGMSVCICISVLTLVLEPLISPSDKKRSPTEEMVWKDLETTFTAIFTLEYLLRLSVADALGDQTWLDFVKAPMNICDITAVMPFYVDLLLGTVQPKQDGEKKKSQDHFRLFRLIRLMRLARLVRLGRLAKKSAHLAPVAVIMVLIWGIFMKHGV